MNWIYRRNTDNVARDSGGNLVGDPCHYAIEGQWIGFQNIDSFGMPGDVNRPGNVRFWWMDEQMLELIDIMLSYE